MTASPAAMLRRIQKLRDRRHWYGEFKFTAVTRGILPLYRDLVDLVLDDGDTRFFCFVADRADADPVARFGTHWDAYEKLAEQLILAAIRNGELVTVLADNYSTPDEVLFEETVKASVNRRLRRLAVTSVCRLDSRSSDGLQAVDMMTSAVAFEFRAAAGLASDKSVKADLSRHVRLALGTGPAWATGVPDGTVSLSTSTASGSRRLTPLTAPVNLLPSGVDLWSSARDLEKGPAPAGPFSLSGAPERSVTWS